MFKFEVKFKFANNFSIALMCDDQSQVDRELECWGAANLVEIKQNF